MTTLPIDPARTLPIGTTPLMSAPTVPVPPSSGRPIHYATTPPPRRLPPTSPKRRIDLPSGSRRVELAILATTLLGLTVAAVVDDGLTGAGAATLAVFAIAVWAWIRSDLDDTYVALAAAVALVPLGGLTAESFYAGLGQELVWLLVAAFVLAAVITASGLVTRCAAAVVSRARSPRGLVHLMTTALMLTAFAVPSTSGRAALAVPIFVVLAKVFTDRPQLVRVLALLFPTVILLSAVASLLGAGAHLITSAVVAEATGSGFGFAGWALLGVPLAVATSHLAAELVLWLFADRRERERPLSVDRSRFADQTATPVDGRLTVDEKRCALLLVAVVALWCSESLHGVDAAVVAVAAALVATAPWFGRTRLRAALATVPWSLLVFMAATLALGHALMATGAAHWLAEKVFLPVSALGSAAGPVFVVLAVLTSAAAHLVIQSRSARSAVLIPILVALAPTMGVNPAAVALASTAAAGFCHTLTSSAKPVAMFSSLDSVETYGRADLLRLSAYLGPPFVMIVVFFSWVVWPLLGLDLFLP